MTKYRKRILEHVEVKETYKQTKTVCDFCHREVWEVSKKRSENSVDIEIEARIGNVWEGGEADVRDGYYIDSCSECFMEKVKPALEAAGAVWNEFRPEEAYVHNKYSDYYKDE